MASCDANISRSELDRQPLNAANDDHLRVMTVLVEVALANVLH